MVMVTGRTRVPERFPLDGLAVGGARRHAMPYRRSLLAGGTGEVEVTPTVPGRLRSAG